MKNPGSRGEGGQKSKGVGPRGGGRKNKPVPGKHENPAGLWLLKYAQI